MRIAKRIFLFMAVNILIVVTLSIVLQLLGVQPYLDSRGINYESLMVFCVVWGFGGAFISLLLSKTMAKWMMGVKVVDPRTNEATLRSLVERVHQMAKRAGLSKPPEVGVYEGAELNAFATGPSRSNSLVAVSSGLLRQMNEQEVNGVLAHEVTHIANGDMVTMTLIQGVINAFVMFLSRVLAHVASQFVDENKRGFVQFGLMIALEILFGILGMLVVSAFSRQREFRADKGGAQISGRENMIAALERLKANTQLHGRGGDLQEQSALASLKISGKSGGFMRLFATHPDLDVRIERLKQART